MDSLSEYERQFLDKHPGVEGLIMLAYDVWTYPGEGYTVDEDLRRLVVLYEGNDFSTALPGTS